MITGFEVTSEQFNLIEGLFWITLGLLVFIYYNRCDQKFKRLSLFTILILVTFGLSDFVQALLGSFFQPHLWWLLVWKIIDVFGLVLVFVWYFALRINDSKNK